MSQPMVQHAEHARVSPLTDTGADTGHHPLFGPTSHLSTKEGWADFVNLPRSRAPLRPSRGEWRSMKPSARERLNADRSAHHNSFVVQTPQMIRIHRDLHAQFTANFASTQPGARRGSVIDGQGTWGKTTILIEFGRAIDRALRAEHPEARTKKGDLFIPVLYVCLTGAPTVKGLNSTLLNFYAVPLIKSRTLGDLTMELTRVARRCGTVLFLIDDIHNLPIHTESGRVVNNHLKHLASEIQATFIYAGIDCRESGLFRREKGRTGDGASQIWNRFTLHPVEPFAIDTVEGWKEWLALLRVIEQQLVLIDAPPQMLISLARYLFERTHGSIGSLTELIRNAINACIADESERLTEKLLDSITINSGAEDATTGARGKRVVMLESAEHRIDRLLSQIARARLAAHS